MMRGLVSTPMENLDQFMSGEITNHLVWHTKFDKFPIDKSDSFLLIV